MAHKLVVTLDSLKLLIGLLTLGDCGSSLTDRIDVVVNYTPICVKNNYKLTNLMKISRIEGYNGKYGSNPQGIREISDDLFEFDQIRQ